MADKPLRILIASTPKTGNTWLMALLSAVYDLPKMAVVYPFDPAQTAVLGERWVTFHHMLPDSDLLSWIEDAKPILITTIRHPGDVLISLYHHMNGFRDEPVDMDRLRQMLAEPFARVDIEPPATHRFNDELECSLAWMRLGACPVRYEDLRRDTRRSLTDLTQWIEPVSQEHIEQAILRCDLRLMRSLAGAHKGFFRSGAVGEWRTLPADVLACFNTERYQQQFAELGYSLDGNVPHEQQAIQPLANEARADESPQRNPFHELTQFENHVPVVPILEDYYLSLDPAVNKRWPPIASASPDSFLAWCNRDSVLHGQGLYAGVPLSNLAHYIHRMRPDLQNAFPDLRGRSRADYAEWFIRKHRKVYGLDAYFADPILARFVAWGNARYAGDRVRRPWWPKLTNFAMYVYESYDEVRAWFRDCQYMDRWNYLEWMVGVDHGLPIFPGLSEHIRANLNRLRAIRRLGGAVERQARRLTPRRSE